MRHLEMKFRLKLATSFHTTGNRRRLGADKALALSPEGRYIIPATSLKGMLRDSAETVLRTWGHQVCIGPTPETMCPNPQSLCLACRVFGNPRFPSPLRFFDGHFDSQTQSLIRSGVSISRQRRAALHQRLFFIETTEPGPLTVISHCEGYFANEEEALQAAALVILALRWITAAGGGRTRGLGWLEGVTVETTLDGKLIPQEKLERFWLKWSGGKDVA